jgi:hypothetical protein
MPEGEHPCHHAFDGSESQPQEKRRGSRSVTSTLVILTVISRFTYPCWKMTTGDDDKHNK